MCSSLLRLVCLSVLLSVGFGCYQCFVETEVSGRLCQGHMSTKYGTNDVAACFKTLNRIFNNNPKVIKAGRVGIGYDKSLAELLHVEIMPLVKEFEHVKTPDTVYERRLQTAADNFIAAASKLPRVTGCVPPCGFQIQGAVYNCVTCSYDSCGFPLDCPVKEMVVMEKTGSEMSCDVSFKLPTNIQIIWRFVEQVKTRKVDQFTEVGVGVDKHYSIPTTNLEHGGTYMCEIFSGGRSIVRVYFYIIVTPLSIARHTELQDIFDLSLLPGGRLVPGAPAPPPPPHPLFPSPLLLATCLTSLVLLLFLSLGILQLSQKPKEPEETEEREQTSMEMQEIESESESLEIE